MKTSIGRVNAKVEEICVDTGCTMSLVDRSFLRRNAPDAEIQSLPCPLKVRGIGDNVHSSSDYVLLNLYIPGNVQGESKVAHVPTGNPRSGQLEG